MDRQHTPPRPSYSPITRAGTMSPARPNQDAMPAQPLTVSRYRPPHDFPVPQSVQRETREQIHAWGQAALGPPPGYTVNPPAMGRPTGANPANPLDTGPVLPPPYPDLPSGRRLDEQLRRLQNALPGETPANRVERGLLSPLRLLRSPGRPIPPRANAPSPFFRGPTRTAPTRGPRGDLITPALGAPQLARPINTPTPVARPRPDDPRAPSAVDGLASRAPRSPLPQPPRTPLVGGGVALNAPSRTSGWSEILPGTNQTPRSTSGEPQSPIRRLFRGDERPGGRARGRVASVTSNGSGTTHVSRTSRQSARERRHHPYGRPPPRRQPHSQRPQPAPARRPNFGMEVEEGMEIARRGHGQAEMEGVQSAHARGRGDTYNFRGDVTVNGVGVLGSGTLHTVNVYPSEEMLIRWGLGGLGGGALGGGALGGGALGGGALAAGHGTLAPGGDGDGGDGGRREPSPRPNSPESSDSEMPDRSSDEN